MKAEKIFDTGKVKIEYLGNRPVIRGTSCHVPRWCLVLAGTHLSLIPCLSKNWLVYALDLRGNGKSGWVAGQYRLEDFASDRRKFPFAL